MLFINARSWVIGSIASQLNWAALRRFARAMRKNLWCVDDGRSFSRGRAPQFGQVKTERARGTKGRDRETDVKKGGRGAPNGTGRCLWPASRRSDRRRLHTRRVPYLRRARRAAHTSVRYTVTEVQVCSECANIRARSRPSSCKSRVASHRVGSRRGDCRVGWHWRRASRIQPI